MPISHDAQRLAPDLPAAVGHLVPCAVVELAAAVAELAGERDDLGDDEFGDGAGVAEGRVEDGDAGLRGESEVDLVSADAEAADYNEVFGGFEDALGELGFGADSNDMDLSEGRSVIPVVI